jgi:trigger factor
MEILLDKKDELNATLRIKLKEEDYQPKVNAKLKEYSKNIQLKGFRQGKVPTALVNKMYGKSILVDELNNLLQESLFGYIKDNSLNILGEPLPNTEEERNVDFDNQKEFSFSYDLGIEPNFQYDLKKMTFDKLNIIVDEKLLEKTLQNVRLQFGTTQPADVIESGDNYSVEFILGEETKKGTIFSEKTSEKAQKMVLGKKVGDILQIDPKNFFQEEYQAKHFLGLSDEQLQAVGSSLEIKILDIKRQLPANLDQDLFDKVLGKDKATDEASFKAQLKEIVESNYKIESDYLLSREIQKKSMTGIDFELPNEFIKRWLLATSKNNLTPEQLERDFDTYLKDLKWMIFKNRIARDYDLKVSDEEVKQSARQAFLSQIGLRDIGEEHYQMLDSIVEKQLKENNGKLYNDSYFEIMRTKINALIQSQAQLLEKSVSVEEFEKIASQE